MNRLSESGPSLQAATDSLGSSATLDGTWQGRDIQDQQERIVA